MLSPPTLHHSPPSGHPRLPPAGSSGLGSGWPWPPLSPGPPAASGAAPPAAPGPCRAPAPAPAAQPEPQPAPGVRRARPGVRAWTSLAPSPGPLAHLEPYLEELVSLLPQVTVLAGPTHWGTVHCAVLQRLCQELSLRLAHADCPSQELTEPTPQLRRWVSLAHFLHADSESLRCFPAITQYVQRRDGIGTQAGLRCAGKAVHPQGEG